MSSKSFTLIETVVAVSILTVGTLGAFSLIQKTIGLTSASSSQLTAAYLAQEEIEIVRNIRDSNWLNSQPWGSIGATLNGNVNYDSSSIGDLVDNLVLLRLGEDEPWYFYHMDEEFCVEGGAWHYPDGDFCQDFGNCCLDSRFTRHLEISYPEENIMEVKSIVEWQERWGLQQLTIQTNLYDWR